MAGPSRRRPRVRVPSLSPLFMAHSKQVRRVSAKIDAARGPGLRHNLIQNAKSASNLTRARRGFLALAGRHGGLRPGGGGDSRDRNRWDRHWRRRSGDKGHTRLGFQLRRLASHLRQDTLISIGTDGQGDQDDDQAQPEASGIHFEQASRADRRKWLCRRARLAAAEKGHRPRLTAHATREHIHPAIQVREATSSKHRFKVAGRI